MKCIFVDQATGIHCQAEAWGGDSGSSAYCLMHDPSPTARARHMDMSKKGGRASRAPPRAVDGLEPDFSSPDAILDTLQRTARAVVEGRLDRSRANAVGYLAKTAQETIKTLRHEARLLSIERRLNLRPLTLAEEDQEDTDAKD